MTQEVLDSPAHLDPSILDRAFPHLSDQPGDESARLDQLSRLHAYYVDYLSGPDNFRSIPRLNMDADVREIEHRWLDWETNRVQDVELPASASEFHEWFLAVAEAHTQDDFNHYLASEAGLEEIALFFLAEELVDSKFDDLMAMVQIGTQGVTKLTIAENYWDEMGEGTLEHMHTRLFDHSALYMRAQLDEIGFDYRTLQFSQVYANASLLLAYGIHRHLNPRALGAMGVLEQSASPRFQAMVDGCERLRVPDDVIEYQRIHVHVDADHGAEWTKGVFLPLVERSPELLREISLGIATRIQVANDYYSQVWARMTALKG
ncbi:iron-containing redox enzyme family protein [Gordonia sp. CPCC 206044]|uniref:iron-containing redox enzyme family protein n=1 Tax=Gordonia sp. CPCC 206044 TaxID=3140793 RepID=UPI003AF3C3C2